MALQLRLTHLIACASRGHRYRISWKIRPPDRRSVRSGMSRPRSIRCLPRKVSSHAPTCPAYLPPTFLLPSVPPSTRRSLFTRRSTSFWAQSYPDNQASTSQIPYAPPSPTPRGASASPPPEEGRKKEKKQRYLDSLMDKAGELNLRCELNDSGRCLIIGPS